MSMSVKLPSNFTEEAFKMIVCARVPPNCTEEASKMIVSRVASSKFQRRSFQNDRFVRGFLQISKKKLPKRAFHTRLITIFTKETSKMIVSLKGRPNFTEEDRFARGLPPNVKGEASKMIVSCEASSKFQRRSFQNERFVKMSVSE